MSEISSPRQDRRQAADVPGSHADKPTQIPPRGWKEVALRGWREAKADQVPLLAAGVAFFGFLALFPGMVATVLIWGLVANGSTMSAQTSTLTQSLPSDARSVIASQVQALTATPRAALGWGTLITVLLALWSASGGMNQLVTAITIAYDEKVKRSFVKQRGLALALTVGAVVFLAIVMALVGVAPAVFSAIGFSGPLRWLSEVLRWVLVAAIVMVVLAVLYRVAPDRRGPKLRWVSVGAITATVLWLLASAGFSLYVSLFGHYAKTYGALAGVVLLMLWLWITSYAVLLGAEINAESEEQTDADTTHGPAKPLGRRGAVKADDLPPDEQEAGSTKGERTQGR
ncbi:MAG TPA: YihY/virulence factor BrkB family protein [Propionibacteriaceae bacterium]|nr:YihY/virulence factor BrkB family protein [Propionibacteriaceae bacterium]